MAHYALINNENLVVQVITGVDENLIQIDENNEEVGGTTEKWENFYETRPWFAGLYCKRTSYNNNIRKNYAGIGYKYDANLDAFIAPKPFNSWILDQEICQWKAPKAKPENGLWYWNEETLEWLVDESLDL